MSASARRLSPRTAGSGSPSPCFAWSCSALGCIGARRAFSFDLGVADADVTTAPDGSGSDQTADDVNPLDDIVADTSETSDTTGVDALVGDLGSPDLSFAPLGSIATAPARIPNVTIFAYSVERPPFAFVEADDRLLHLSVEGAATSLFSTKLSGGSTRLSTTGNPNAKIVDFALLGSQVFSLGDPESAKIRGIYRGTTTSPSSLHVTASAIVDGYLDVVSFVPLNSDYLVFAAKTDLTGLTGLYSIDTNGLTLKNLFPGQAIFHETTADGERVLYDVLPNAQGAVFLSDPKINSVRRLFYVGGQLPSWSPTEIAPVASTNAEVTAFHLVASQNRVVYVVSDPGKKLQWLESAPLGAGTAFRVSGDFTQDLKISSFKSALNDSAVLYLVSAVGKQMSALYRAPVLMEATKSTQVSLVIGESVEVLDYVISTSGRYLIYLWNNVTHRLVSRVDLQTADPQTLFDRQLDEDHPVSLAIRGNLAYVVTENAKGRGRRLYSANVVTLQMLALSPAFSDPDTAPYGVRDFVVSPSNNWLTIAGEFRGAGLTDVAVTGVLGGPWIVVTPWWPKNPTATVNSIAFHPDGVRLLFSGDFDVANELGLYQVTY